MAGKRQHFITKELQRGFSNKSKQVYKYTKAESSPIKVNIEKVGVQNKFYGETNCSTDKQLTDYESRTTAFFTTLRNTKSIGDVESISRLVYITLIRSKNFRRAIEQLKKEFADGIASALEERNPYEWLYTTFKEDKSILEELFREELINRGITEGTPEFRRFFWVLMFHGTLHGEKLLEINKDNIQWQFKFFAEKIKQEDKMFGQSVQKKTHK